MSVRVRGTKYSAYCCCSAGQYAVLKYSRTVVRRRRTSTCLAAQPSMLPPNIGDLAPEFEQSLTDGSGSVDRTPTILAFHPRAWDPARADIIDTHRALIHGDAARARRVLIPNDSPLAESFGVANGSAVFL